MLSKNIYFKNNNIKKKPTIYNYLKKKNYKVK